METLMTVLVVCIVVIAIGLMAIIVWREMEHKKQIDELTSKLVARSIGEYASARQAEKTVPPPKPEAPKKLKDPTLGSHY